MAWRAFDGTIVDDDFEEPEMNNSPRGYNSQDVRRLMGNRSTATLYRWMDDPRYGFPKPRKVGTSSTNIWDASEVDAWIAAQFDKAPTIRPAVPHNHVSDEARRLAADLRRTDDVPAGRYAEIAAVLRKAADDIERLA